jgi:hypothetical protein
LRISAVCGTPLRSAVSAIRFAEGIVLAIGCDGKEAGIAVRFREGMGFAVAGMLTALRNGACFRVGIGLAIGEGAALAAAAARLFDGIGFAVACTCSELRNGTCFPEGIGSAIPGEGIEPAAAARLRDDDGFVIARGGIERREERVYPLTLNVPPADRTRAIIGAWFEPGNSTRSGPPVTPLMRYSEASSDFDSNDYGVGISTNLRKCCPVNTPACTESQKKPTEIPSRGSRASINSTAASKRGGSLPSRFRLNSFSPPTKFAF